LEDDFLSFLRYAKENGYPHIEHCSLPRMGAMKSIMEEIGPRYNEDGEEEQSLPRSPSGNVLKLVRDTVGALREKKYVKGIT
jgi:lysophosphatidylglycerol acyltransferase 1